MQAASQGSKFEAEIREEKEERKRQEVEKKQRQAAFKQLQSTFCSWPDKQARAKCQNTDICNAITHNQALYLMHSLILLGSF